MRQKSTIMNSKYILTSTVCINLLRANHSEYALAIRINATIKLRSLLTCRYTYIYIFNSFLI